MNIQRVREKSFNPKRLFYEENVVKINPNANVLEIILFFYSLTDCYEYYKSVKILVTCIYINIFLTLTSNQISESFFIFNKFALHRVPFSYLFITKESHFLGKSKIIKCRNFMMFPYLVRTHYIQSHK